MLLSEADPISLENQFQLYYYRKIGKLMQQLLYVIRVQKIWGHSLAKQIF